MAEYTFSSIADALAAIKRDTAAKERRLQTAIRKTARQTRNHVVRTVPRAFGELADSIEAFDLSPGNSEVVADAPHAAAVEKGSRPHWVPLDALIAWVELRGMQGLTKAGNVRTSGFARGAREHATSIGGELNQKLGRAGAKAWRARAAQGPLAKRETGHDPATVAIAKAIQLKIARSGTKPRRFMANSVPAAMDYLDGFVREAMADK